MTMHFRPPMVELPYRRAAMAAAGAACLAGALAVGGYNLHSNIEYLHHGYAWACASLPLADPGYVAESFFGGAEDRALTIAATAHCAISELADAGHDAAATAARLLQSTVSQEFADLRGGFDSARDAAALARGTVTQGISDLVTGVGHQISDFASLSPSEMADQAKKIAANALELFLAVKAVKVGYKAATSWLKRKFGKAPAITRLAQASDLTPAQATNVTINLTIAAGDASPEDVKKTIAAFVGASHLPRSSSGEMGGADVMDAVLEAVEEGANLYEGVQEQLSDLRSAAIEQTGQPEIPIAIAETIAQGFGKCEDRCEKISFLEVDL